jgi:hypothetical protein
MSEQAQQGGSNVGASGEAADVAGGPPADPFGNRVTVSLSFRKLTGLWFINTLLTVLTFGIYRFWARTRLRKLAWSSIKLDGDGLEYTGRGTELFVGFLIAAAILAPVLGTVWLLLQLAPTDGIVGLALSYGSYGLLYVILAPVAQYYARRYLLSRTRWRGIAGSQDAELKDWMKRHIGWYLRNVLTLGVVAPWTSAERYNYRARHTRFGAEPFTASAQGDALVAPWVWVWPVLMLTIGAFAVLMMPIVGDDAIVELAVFKLKATFSMVTAALVCVLIGVHLRFELYKFRHFAAHTKLGDVTFVSEARGRTIAGVMAVIVVSSIAIVIESMYVFSLVLEYNAAKNIITGSIIFGIAFFGFGAAVACLFYGVGFRVGLLQAYVGTLRVHGLQTLSGMMAVPYRHCQREEP